MESRGAKHGKPSKTALVIGNGPGWQQETVRFYDRSVRVFGVNRSVIDCPVPVDYAVSIHPDHIARAVEQSPWNPKVYTLPDYEFRPPWSDLNSGMCAVCLAIDMGFDTVRVAGLPMTDRTYDRRVIMSLLDKLAPVIRAHVQAPSYYWWAQYLALP